MKRTYQMSAFSSILAMVSLMLFVGSSSATDLRSWSDKIENHHRFKVLKKFNGEAVLDRETRLVWERSPSTSTATWSTARHECAKKEVGGRLGWRLPSFNELASLVDRSKASPSLPEGHPFLNVSPVSLYWTTTFDVIMGTGVVTVKFLDGTVGMVANTETNNLVWCVRGSAQGPTLQ